MELQQTRVTRIIFGVILAIWAVFAMFPDLLDVHHRV
jgi:hypothetical protein